jgi:hypothetical protein
MQEARRRSIRRNPRYLHTVRRVARAQTDMWARYALIASSSIMQTPRVKFKNRGEMFENRFRLVWRTYRRLLPKVNLCCPVLVSYSSVASLEGQQCGSLGPQRVPVRNTDAPSTPLIRPIKLISSISASVITRADSI